MKTTTDLYTKIVLTVIAVFLGVIVFKNIDFVEKANASALPLPAATTATDEVINVNIVEIDGRRVYGSQLPVNIEEVNGNKVYGSKLPVTN